MAGSTRLFHRLSLVRRLVRWLSAGERKSAARDGGYDGVDPAALSEGLNYLVHGAWFWDHVNPPAADSDVFRKTVLRLLHQAFPRHFDLAMA